MSRKGHKTANLPTAITDMVDKFVREGRFPMVSNRDQFVRLAVTLLLLAADDRPDSPLERFMHEARRLRLAQ